MSSGLGAPSQVLAKALNQDPIVAALIGQLPIGIVVAARDGQLEYINALASALFAEHRRASETATPHEPEALEPLRWMIGRALLTNEVIRDEEIQYLDTRDEWRTLCVSATPVEQTYAGPTHVVLSFYDVTERNRGRDWEPFVRSLSRL